MKIIYNSDQDKFIELNEDPSLELDYHLKSYTSDELDFLLAIGEENKKGINFFQILELYPTAKRKLRSAAIVKIKLLKKEIDRVDGLRDVYEEHFIKTLDLVDQGEFKKYLEKDVMEKIEELQARIKRFEYQKKFLTKEIKKEADLKKGKKVVAEAKKELDNAVEEHQIKSAKEVPIRNFIKVGRNNTSLCLFHNDSSPSMHVYKNNTYHCFSCGADGTVIDIVMKLEGCTFVEAVKKILNL